MSDYLKGDAFRQFVVIEVPGVIALWSWALVLLQAFPEVSSFVQLNAGASVFIGLAFTTAVGLVLEDVGARIELMWDRLLAKSREEHESEWWEFLTTPRDESLPAVGYLRSVLLRTKFELGACPALISSIAGLWVAQCAFGVLPEIAFGVAAALHAALFAFLLYESWCGISLLSDIRNRILAAGK